MFIIKLFQLTFMIVCHLFIGANIKLYCAKLQYNLEKIK